MATISATEVRSNFSEILGRVAYGKERVTIERRGRPLAVLLPVEDLLRLEAGPGGGLAGASHILSAVADNIPGTIYQRVQYPDGREEYSYISPGIRNTFGLEPDAMISDPATLSRAIHPQDRERRARAIAESARTLSPYDVQYRVRTPAGETKWLHAIARPERRADGAIAWTGLTLDITKRKETEAALGESEARYRDIIENVGDLIQSIGPDGRYLFVNQAWKDVLGYSDAEAKAMRFAEVVHPDYLAHCVEIFEGLGRGRSFENVSVVFVAKDGREIAVEGHLSCVLEAGQFVRTRAIFHDVTERRKTEAALRESESRYRSLYDSIPLSVWEEDWSEVKKMIDRLAAEGVSDWETYFQSRGDEVKRAFDLCKTLNINPATREMYRAPNADNALDLILGPLVVEAELRKFASWLASFAEGHTTFVGESEEPRIDGTTFKARVRSYIPPEHADTWDRVITTVEDVTAFSRTQEALRESEARLRDLIDGSIEGILIHRDHKPLLVNEAWAAIHGSTVDEIMGIDSVLDLISPLDRERLSGYRDARLRGEEAPVRYEYRALRQDGSAIWLEHLVRVIDWEGAPAIQAVVIDITERKSAQAALEGARDELERRVEERTQELHATNRALEEEVGTRKAVEERLRESERDLSNLIEGSIQGMVIITEERTQRFANQAYAEIFGYDTPAEILALDSTLDLVAPYEVARLNELRKPIFADEEAPISYIMDGIRKDGATIRLQCMARALTWRGERVVQVTLYDITERERAERALRESEERYRELFDESPVAIWEEDWSPIKRMLDDLARRGVTDWRGYFNSHRDQLRTAYDLAKITEISRATIDIYRVANKEELVRTSVAALVIDEELDAFREIVLSVLAGQMTVDIEAKDTTGDGSEIIVRRRVVIPPKYRDDWSRVIYAIEDITERRKAEETVRTRDAWLRAILENAPIQIVLKDTGGRIMAISRNVGEMLGVTVDELVGRTTADFLPQRVAEVYMSTDREVVETGRSIQQEVVEDWDGVTRHFLNSKFPLRDDSGRIVGVCSLTNDMTEVKQSEEHLRQAQKMEAVGQLTGGVAHDFNNLLAVILGNAEMLSERLGAEDRQVAAVMRAAERGAELTQRLLAFSRRQPLKPQEIDLAGRVAGMTELLTRTLGATIEISVASTPGLWRAMADPGQLENALLNLAINARDAMTEGGRLSISTANASLEPGEIATLLAGQALEAADGEPGDPRDYVVLSVSDNGTGMSPAVLARVFEPFFTTKDVGQGSGLGLSMVYGFARQSGGFAAIESTPGRGTTVRLYLPRAVVAAPAPGARDRAGQLPHGHGETVLLLEDAQDVRELAVALLENLGYRVLAAAEAAEAGALLAENPGVALLLTDVILPGERSGTDFAETARRHNPALKVLFMSGYPTEALMQRGDSFARDTPLLTKPFRKAVLARAVREALDDPAEVQGPE